MTLYVIDVAFMTKVVRWVFHLWLSLELRNSSRVWIVMFDHHKITAVADVCSGWSFFFEIRAPVAGRFEKHVVHPAFTSIFGWVEDGAHRELCTQQMRQIQPTAFGLHRRSDTDGRVGDIFNDVFIYQNCSFTKSLPDSIFPCYSPKLALVHMEI